ncbi:hypothetical protein [Streptomyces sp. NPDC056723]|uniref:hypothetical protein n=1 Tax=Streptomyces sp. NPDC056723 TaxID=3345925 RepID=UPI003681D59A
MPDTPTTRLGLYKSAANGSELVNYTQDIGNNWDKVDAASGFQIVTSGTRPAAPYAGKPIAESDTGYRTYFSNGTSPASASWIEIPNSSGTFGGNLNLGGTQQINIGGSGSTAAYAIRLATATGDYVMSSRVGGDANSRYTIRTDGQLAWGAGVTGTDTFLARSGVGRLALTGTDAALTIGTATYRNQLAPTTATTVANTVTETAVATLTIPANDVVAGSIYRIEAWGIASVTGTPTFTVQARLGGAAGTSMGTTGAITASTGVTNRAWSATFDLVCITTGAAATWRPALSLYQDIAVAALPGQNRAILQTGTVTRDSTAANAMVLTWTWGTASASNTATCQGVIARRLA